MKTKHLLASIVGAVAGALAAGGIQALKSAWLQDSNFWLTVFAIGLCGACIGCIGGATGIGATGNGLRKVGLGTWLVITVALAAMIVFDLAFTPRPFGYGGMWYCVFIPVLIGVSVGRLFGDSGVAPQNLPASGIRLPVTEPLVTYFESQLGVNRKFDLYADRVIVLERKSTGISEVTIMLGDLHPRAIKLWRPHPQRAPRRTTFALAALGWVQFAVVFFVAGSRTPWWIYFFFAILASLQSGVVCWRSFKRVPWTQYRNRAGITVLDFFRAGPEQRDRYDAFAKALELQIMAAQRLKAQLTPKRRRTGEWPACPGEPIE